MSAIEQLSKYLQSLDGPVGRKSIVAKRKEVRGKKARAKPRPASPGTELPTTILEVENGEPIQAFLLTLLSRIHQGALKKDRTDGDPACIRLGLKVADDAALVAVTTMGLLPVLYTKLHAWGFAKFSSIYLPAQPVGPEVTDEKVIVTCKRGNVKLPTLEGWPTETDPIKLAEYFVRDIQGRKVHLFADQPRPGWESVIGEANWSVT